MLKKLAQLNIKIAWKGKNIKECGVDQKTGKVLVRIDPKYFRPTEVDFLKGDASKARKILGCDLKHHFLILLKK